MEEFIKSPHNNTKKTTNTLEFIATLRTAHLTNVRRHKLMTVHIDRVCCR